MHGRRTSLVLPARQLVELLAFGEATCPHFLIVPGDGGATRTHTNLVETFGGSYDVFIKLLSSRVAGSEPRVATIRTEH